MLGNTNYQPEVMMLYWFLGGGVSVRINDAVSVRTAMWLSTVHALNQKPNLCSTKNYIYFPNNYFLYIIFLHSTVAE